MDALKDVRFWQCIMACSITLYMNYYYTGVSFHNVPNCTCFEMLMIENVIHGWALMYPSQMLLLWFALKEFRELEANLDSEFGQVDLCDDDDQGNKQVLHAMLQCVVCV